MAAVPAADVERMEFQLGLRRRGISDQAVLRAMDEVPREHFVAAEFTDSAYADQALPIACGQTISQPYVVGYMTEQLDLAPNHRVLEIGTGSGYQAAVLSRIAREVVTIERYRTLADAARARLKTLGYSNVTVRTGDGFAGAPEQAPFDRIIVTAAAEEVPNALRRAARGERQDDSAARAAPRHAVYRQAVEVRGRRNRARGPDRRSDLCRCCRAKRANCEALSRRYPLSEILCAALKGLFTAT